MYATMVAMRPLTIFQFLFVLAITVVLAVHAIAIARGSARTVEKFEAVAAAANIDSAIDLKKKDIAETVTFGLYSGATDQKSALDAMRVEAEASRAQEWKDFQAFMIVVGGAVVLSLLIGRFSPRSDVVVSTLLSVSCVMLVLGVFTPMLSFTNERELPVVGKVIAEAQVKSVWGSAMALFNSGDTWVAIAIVGASMAIPLAKSTLLVIVLGNRALLVDRGTVRQESVERRLAKLASMIGQFSFVDLFVAAVFLSIFALRSFEGSRAQSEPGLYYFNTYCTVSLIAGLLAWRAPKQRWVPPA